MITNRQFIRDQLETAWQAKLRGEHETAIKTLIRAVAEGDASPEENLRVLVEEAATRRPHPRPRRTIPDTRRRPPS